MEDRYSKATKTKHLLHCHAKKLRQEFRLSWEQQAEMFTPQHRGPERERSARVGLGSALASLKQEADSGN